MHTYRHLVCVCKNACACTHVYIQDDVLLQVLEGHMFVGTLRVLGSALSSHFGDLLASQTLGAVHRAAATARPPVDLRHVSNMHEAARTLPPHFLWSALSKVRLLTTVDASQPPRLIFHSSRHLPSPTPCFGVCSQLVASESTKAAF
jgi:hypothetical protein